MRRRELVITIAVCSAFVLALTATAAVYISSFNKKRDEQARIPGIRAFFKRLGGTYCAAYNSEFPTHPGHRFALVEIGDSGEVTSRIGFDDGTSTIKWFDHFNEGDQASIDSMNTKLNYDKDGTAYTISHSRNPKGVDSYHYYRSMFPEAPKVKIRRYEPPHKSGSYENQGEDEESSLWKIQSWPSSFEDFQRQKDEAAKDFSLQQKG